MLQFIAVPGSVHQNLLLTVSHMLPERTSRRTFIVVFPREYVAIYSLHISRRTVDGFELKKYGRKLQIPNDLVKKCLCQVLNLIFLKEILIILNFYFVNIGHISLTHL